MFHDCCVSWVSSFIILKATSPQRFKKIYSAGNPRGDAISNRMFKARRTDGYTDVQRRSSLTGITLLDIFFFSFFDLGFTVLSRIFHLYRADRSSKVGENRSTRRKTT